MDQEYPDAMKSVYFVGFWMPLEKTIDQYTTISRAKERLPTLMDQNWHLNASYTICGVDPSSGERKWVESSTILTLLFNSWLQCCALIKPRVITNKDCYCTKGGKVPSSPYEPKDLDGPSWLNQSIRGCPLLNVMTVGFSGFEIDRLKLSSVIENFSQKLMSLMSSIQEDRKAQTNAHKGAKIACQPKNQRFLAPLQSWIKENTPISLQKSVQGIQYQLEFTSVESQFSFTRSNQEQTNDFFDQVAGNQTFIDRLLTFVEQFIDSSSIKWQCVLEFSLYIIEIDRSTLVKYGMPAADMYDGVQSVRILWPAINFYEAAMRIYSLLTLTGKATLQTMAQLMTQTFPNNFGPTCSSCLVPILDILDRHCHILNQNCEPEQKIKDFSEVVRHEILTRWKEFILIKSKGLFNNANRPC